MEQVAFEQWLASARPVRRRGRRKLPRQVAPKTIELEFYKAIRAMMTDANETLREALDPVTQRVLRADADEPTKQLLGAIDRASESFFRRWSRARLESMANQFGQRVADFQKVQLLRQTKALGLNVVAGDAQVGARIAGFAAENVSLIKSIPTRYFDEVEKLVMRAAADGLRHEVIAKQIQERFGVSQASARLVARDQVGKLYGAIQEQRQTALGVTEYIWRTSNDERVRDEHAQREGETFSWDNAPEDGHPGAAINCRCFAEPVIPEP